MSYIRKFYENMSNAGIRYSYQYEAALSFPGPGSAPALMTEISDDAPMAPQFRFYCQSASLPARMVSQATINWFGAALQVPFSMSYTHSLNLRITCDPSMTLRSMFEDWMNTYASIGSAGMGEKSLRRTATLDLILLDQELKKTLDVYHVKGCWPSTIGEMEMGQGSTEISTFTATLAFQYYTRDSSNTLNEDKQ